MKQDFVIQTIAKARRKSKQVNGKNIFKTK